MPFYVFEGGDQSGKSTQCSLLGASLCKRPDTSVLSLKYPDRASPLTGKLISDYLAKRVDLNPTAASLLLLANLWEMLPAIERSLHSGQTVIMDRYVWSNIAYSVARGVEKRVLERLASGLPIPDRAFLVDTDPQLASRRGTFGTERFDQVEFQRIITCHMQQLARESVHPVTILDGSLAPEEIHQLVMATIDRP